MNKRIAIVTCAAALALSACGREEAVLTVGSKDFAESEVLAHVIALMAERENIAVERKIPLGDTRQNLEALKRGDIDIYPEYNGTALVMLGQPAIPDGDAATARVETLYAALELAWSPRLGFANNYGLAMTATRARELGVDSLSDLAGRAAGLGIGIEENFQKRPLDGFTPLSRRYGLDFETVEVVTAEERTRLYDLLLGNRIDVAEVFTTDGQIDDYNLVLLEDDLGFFPVYQAAPLMRREVAERFPNLVLALGELAGRLDAGTMQDLNRQVDIEGRAPDAVARTVLAGLGLIEADAGVAEAEVLTVAVNRFERNEAQATRTLRATRKAFNGRPVELLETPRPLDAIATGRARLGMVGAEAFFDLSTPVPRRREGFEAVALVGHSTIHLVTAGDGPLQAGEIERLAVPADSASEDIGKVLIAGLGSGAELLSRDVDGVSGLLEVVDSGEADAALLFLPIGHQGLVDAFAGGGYRLRPVTGWERGNNLVRYPFLRTSRIPPGAYATQFTAIESLGAQLVLAGPAPATGDTIGDRGPGGGIVTEASPLPAASVTALNTALDSRVRIDPVLPQAGALLPALPAPPAAVNRSADQSVLNMALIVLLTWFLWIYVRPERR